MLRDDLLTRALAIALVVVVLGVVYVAVGPAQTGQSVTEFYLLNGSGVAGDYPDSLSVGETGTVVVGVTNRRRSTTTYAVVVRFDGRTVAEYDRTLERGATDERAVEFTPERAGEFRLRAALYTGGDTTREPSQTLRLHVTVHGEGTGDGDGTTTGTP